MKIVSFYEMAPDALPKLSAHFPADRARLDEFHARGILIAAGPLDNPPDGALAIFTTRAAAEEFIQGDSFVVNGLVAKWRLVEWNPAFIEPETEEGSRAGRAPARLSRAVANWRAKRACRMCW